MKRTLTLSAFLILLGFQISAQHSVARQWNEVLLNAIRNDFARPTVHARNLYHTSAALYDAWAAYDSIAQPLFLTQECDCPFEPFQVDSLATPENKKAAQEEAMSYAAYVILKTRFQFSPGGIETLNSFDSMMVSLGYDINVFSIDYAKDGPAALGNYIAEKILFLSFNDGANELFDYANEFYEPVNEPLVMDFAGNESMTDPNRWQPLTLDVFIDQSGNPIPLNTPDFLSAEWGQVTPFALKEEDRVIYERDGFEYWVYHDPGPPPYLDTTQVGGLSEEYKWGFALVAVWASHLDPADSVFVDISPASNGNNQLELFPETFEAMRDFYDLEFGGDNSTGHDINPVTGQPYEPNIVPRADFARILAEFWADGPDSETPPGHWFSIMNYVHDHPLFERRYRGMGEEIDPLEWDVKAYLTLGGAMHDAAVATWGIKGWYDYVRPVSAIRYMAELGQSTDTTLSNFHPGGIPLIPGYIEVIDEDDPLSGNNNQHVGKIKLYTWRGPRFIRDPKRDKAGVGWIRAADWWPYQRPSFVTPPFAGYVSGHSTFSRAAAEVLTFLTGDPYFPGGLGEFEARQNEFLVFERGPSQDITLQWATYRDAADETSLSRIWGGIHPPADDIPGRIIGKKVADDAVVFADALFYPDLDGDGFNALEDCNNRDTTVFPGAPELADSLDNDCNGLIDDNTATSTRELVDRSFSLFPNPVSHEMILEFEPLAENAMISIMKLDGKVVTLLEKDLNTGQINIDTKELSNGLYLLKMVGKRSGFMGVKKFTVLR